LLLKLTNAVLGGGHEDVQAPLGADNKHELAIQVLLRLSHPEAHDAASGVKRLEVQREFSKVEQPCQSAL
jgi:hypothetical protein